MTTSTISNNQSLIINSPYEIPDQHWKFGKDESRQIVQDRREAGYMVGQNNTGTFKKIELVNKIRNRVNEWRSNKYPGVTSVTKKLLEHWNDKNQRTYQFFFCQLEAIETLIWLIEANETEKIGLEIPGDGSSFSRLCSKLATGAGKTIVMAMLIAWQTSNKIAYPRDGRFSKNFLVIAPNLTVKDRLSVLLPSNPGNYYKEFRVVEPAKMDRLNQANIKIHNWHQLSWENEEKIKKRKGVDKRGVKSNTAYASEVLGNMAKAKNIVVINDEAHHAWRIPADMTGLKKDEKEQATLWMGGLDRINNTNGILHCFDFSATPFITNGKDIKLFDWIVSDFGLNDAIESGLVKIPQICYRDDSLPDTKTYESRLKHIYYDREVKNDLNRKNVPEDTPLPDLVKTAYLLLGNDWEKTKKQWGKSFGHTTPPVMITVANITKTASRIKYAFDNRRFIACEELSDKGGILHIDSKVLKDIEDEGNNSLDTTENNHAAHQTKKQKEALLRRKAATVGQPGEPGEKIQNVISVGMLSEGWDAHTVTHIMGLRAFTSQLLCEQTIGRGLRRSSYDINQDSNRFMPEYVNILGIPFNMLPHEDPTEVRISPPTTTIEAVPEKIRYEISWPNVIKIDRAYPQSLVIDWNKVKPLQLDATNNPKVVELAPIIDGKPDITKLTYIDLELLLEGKRLQTILFELASSTYRQRQPDWQGSKHQLIADIVRICFEYIDSGKLQVIPKAYNQDIHKRKVIIALNDTRILNHLWDAIDFNSESTPTLTPVFDPLNEIARTGDMPKWKTTKKCNLTEKSHINYCVHDSTWEQTTMYELEKNPAVHSWVKNERLNFCVEYSYNGIIYKYFPDFIIKLTSGKMLILEVKGQPNPQTEAKHNYMQDWITAVNSVHSQKWEFQVAIKPGQVQDILLQANSKMA